MLGIERADVEAGNRVRLKRVKKPSLFKVESRNFGAVADKVDVAIGRMVDKIAAEFGDSESVVTTILRVNLTTNLNCQKKSFLTQSIHFTNSIDEI